MTGVGAGLACEVATQRRGIAKNKRLGQRTKPNYRRKGDAQYGNQSYKRRGTGCEGD